MKNNAETLLAINVKFNGHVPTTAFMFDDFIENDSCFGNMFIKKAEGFYVACDPSVTELQMACLVKAFLRSGSPAVIYGGSFFKSFETMQITRPEDVLSTIKQLMRIDKK